MGSGWIYLNRITEASRAASFQARTAPKSFKILTEGELLQLDANQRSCD